MTATTDVPTRLLLGSGPSPVPERVLAALAQPERSWVAPTLPRLAARLT